MQDKVRNFTREQGLSADAQSRYIDLASEVGELGKEILKATGYGKEPFRVSEGFAEEMGDCVFSLLCLCEAAGVDAVMALDEALAKYRARMDVSGSIGSGGTMGENAT